MEILSYFFYILNIVSNIFIGAFVRIGIFRSALSHPVNDYDAAGNPLIVSVETRISAVDILNTLGIGYLGTALYISIAVAITTSALLIFGVKKKWAAMLSICAFFLSAVLFAVIMFISIKFQN
ncbi:MAG: hypothetical protein IKE27_07600 [Oscillospiraceae bacterium]|nr:hypothetical protein [Oscillospiraceae bacterium]